MSPHYDRVVGDDFDAVRQRSGGAVADRFRLDGKVAIVTGASRGIGAACALALAEAGCDAVLASRDESTLRTVADQIGRLGRRAVVAPTDVTDLDAAARLADVVQMEFGGVDIVVNNAGGAVLQPFMEITPDVLEHAFRYNVTSAFVVTKAAVPSMLERGGGSVVNISSAIGRFANRGVLSYGTAKAAMSHMTRLAAFDLAPKIRVNAIAPGSIATDSLATLTTSDAARSAMEAATPLRRLGDVADVAAACLWLASPASSFVTGKVIEVDGGIQASPRESPLPDL